MGNCDLAPSGMIKDDTNGVEEGLVCVMLVLQW